MKEDDPISQPTCRFWPSECASRATSLLATELYTALCSATDMIPKMASRLGNFLRYCFCQGHRDLGWGSSQSAWSQRVANLVHRVVEGRVCDGPNAEERRRGGPRTILHEQSLIVSWPAMRRSCPISLRIDDHSLFKHPSRRSCQVILAEFKLISWTFRGRIWPRRRWSKSTSFFGSAP